MSCFRACVGGWIAVLMVCSAPGYAADLGSSCCADLEERIAEIESSAVRKGNRKVSLSVSGWVSQAVFFWDDGKERNVYVGTNSLEQDRFRFVGESKISDGWSAGYTLEIGFWGADSKLFSQDSTGSVNSFIVRKSNWWLKSKELGRLLVGLDGSATYHLLDDADPTQTRNVSDALAAGVAQGAFLTRSNGVLGPKWTDIMRGFDNSTPGQGGRRDIVRYDSPTIAGFTLVVAWGEDDLWDAALAYKNDVGEFTLVGRIGYGESTDDVATKCGGSEAGFKCNWWGAAGTILHKPTGMFIYGGWGEQSLDTSSIPDGLNTDSTVWFIQPGIEKKWSPLGNTTIFGEYRHDEPGASINSANVAKTLGADLTFWAGGIIQNFENAEMLLYAVYRRADGDYTDGAGSPVHLDDFQMIITGAKMNF